MTPDLPQIPTKRVRCALLTADGVADTQRAFYEFDLVDCEKVEAIWINGQPAVPETAFKTVFQVC